MTTKTKTKTKTKTTKPIKLPPQVFTIAKTLTVMTEPLSPKGLYAYRCTMKSQDHVPNKTWEGICETDALPTPDNLCPTSNWTLLTRKQLDELARWGYTGKSGDFRLWHKLPKTPYKILTDPKRAQEYTLIRDDHKAHMIFDELGRPLPVAMFFDYVQGYNNEKLDLTKAHAHLKKHPHVKNLSAIEEVPYYNRDDSMTHGLSFMWTPAALTYWKAWNWCVASKSEYPSTEFEDAIWALDLLGLRKCKALKKTSSKA